jgi:hypothetical protein
MKARCGETGDAGLLAARRWLQFCDKFTPQLTDLHARGLLLDVEVRAVTQPLHPLPLRRRRVQLCRCSCPGS